MSEHRIERQAGEAGGARPHPPPVDVLVELQAVLDDIRSTGW